MLLSVSRYHPYNLRVFLFQSTSVVSKFSSHSLKMSTPPNNRKRDANHLSGSAGDAKKPKSNGSITSFFGVPASKPAVSSTFNKAKWVSSLTPEQKDLLKLEIDTLDESWLAHLKGELVTKEFLDLKRFLKSELDSGTKVFPPLGDVYSW